MSKLQKGDFFSGIYNDKDNISKQIQYYLSTSKDSGYETTVNGKIADKIKYLLNNEFMSVSYLPELAAVNARRRGLMSGDGSKNVVMGVKLPKLSIIRQDGLMGNFNYAAEGKTLRVNGIPYQYDNRKGEIEAFVPFKISVDNVMSVDEIKAPHAFWY